MGNNPEDIAPEPLRKVRIFMKKTVKAAVTAAVIIAAAVLTIGPVRLITARKKADEFAAEEGIDLTYEGSDDLDSKEAFLTEIWQIALWEEKTRTEINNAFGRTDNEQITGGPESKSGYEKEEELLAFALKEKWQELRVRLDRYVKDVITQCFESADNTCGLDEWAVRNCYRNNYFGKINEMMRSVENGAGMEAYNLSCHELDDDWSALPMDIAYGLRPKLITAGCQAALLSAVKSDELYKVRSAVNCAEMFAARYGARVDGLEDAKKKEERLEFANRPDVPAVGMSASKARSTRLGAPTRTTTGKGSWSHKEHTYGDMVWESGGREIFRVHYFDGEITDVYDNRSSTAKSPWTSSRSGSPKTSFDPEDHDIEAYYEDNRDEYSSYDDAYEGFLDDEGAWDDY